MHSYQVRFLMNARSGLRVLLNFNQFSFCTDQVLPKDTSSHSCSESFKGFLWHTCNFLLKRISKIINENYFCVRHKNRWKLNRHLKLLFFTLNLHFRTLNWVSIYEKLKILINMIYLVFFSIEMQGRLIQSKVYFTFH